ncbi:MAG: bifunctional diguanylate cyclase/phosphodiesterase [Salinarimonas sp.]
MFPIPANEAERLAAVRALRIVDTDAEAPFDAACRTAARLVGTPISLVTIVDAERQWFKALHGIEITQTPRDHSFCAHTILSDEPLVVEDATADPRFRANPLVTGEPGVRFYAAVPLVLAPDVRIGTVCVVDTRPRSISAEALAGLRDCATIVVEALRARLPPPATERGTLVDAAEARYRALAEALPHKVWITDAQGQTLYENARLRAYHGCALDKLESRIALRHPEDHARLSEMRAKAMRTGEFVEAEGRLLRHDGVYRWHRLTLSPIRRDGAGRVVEWLAASLDIDDILRDRERLEKTTELLELALEAGGAGWFERDIASGTSRLSRESKRLLGLPDDAPETLSGEGFLARMHPDAHESVARARNAAVASGRSYATEFRVRLPEGRTRWIMAVGRPGRNPETGADRILGLNIDITERKLVEEAMRRSEARLRASEERLAYALEATNEGIWDWDLRTGEGWHSERWAQMLGYRRDEIAPHVSNWRALVHADDRCRVEARLAEHIDGATPLYACEFRVRHKDGSWRWILDRGKVVSRDAAGCAMRMVGTHTDITDRKEAEHRAERMARHDGLTDLPNRAHFRERLDEALDVAAKTGESVALVCLDLDRFKAVNDTLGHPVGDALLKAVAGRLAGQVRASDVLARLGGDEFAVLQIGAEQPEAARALAQRLSQAFATPVSVAGRDLSVGLSIGVAIAPHDGADADQLFKSADLALYRAKGEGRSTVRFFEPAMDASERERQELEIDLREAIARQELDLHFQPALDLASGAVAGFEALARWTHPVRGPIPPDRFVPLAEQSKLITGLGDFVLRRACAVAASWPAPTRVAVNVSPAQFDSDDLVAKVADALDRAGLPASRLELEITETVLIGDDVAVVRQLQALRDLGVRIALDDFGTGYSSLSYLRRFAFDRIKIDRSFIRDMHDPDTAAIVRAIVGLGARLGIAITAEGIETEAQLARVKAEGCAEAQGWLIGRPGSADAARARLAQRAA